MFPVIVPGEHAVPQAPGAGAYSARPCNCRQCLDPKHLATSNKTFIISENFALIGNFEINILVVRPQINILQKL